MAAVACACLAAAALATGCGGDDASLGPVTVTVTETVAATATGSTTPAATAPPATVPAETAGGGGDEAAIREVYEAYAAAFLALDGAEACSHLSPAGEAQTVMEGRRQGFGADCPDAVRAAALVLKSRQGSDVTAALGDVEVSGDSARATAVYRGSKGATEGAPTFERLGGGWYVGPDRG